MSLSRSSKALALAAALAALAPASAGAREVTAHAVAGNLGGDLTTINIWVACRAMSSGAVLTHVDECYLEGADGTRHHVPVNVTGPGPAAAVTWVFPRVPAQVYSVCARGRADHIQEGGVVPFYSEIACDSDLLPAESLDLPDLPPRGR